jgi:hypothetical protein
VYVLSDAHFLIQVQVLTAAVEALQTATSYSDSNDNNAVDNSSNNHTARSSHRTAATGTCYRK